MNITEFLLARITEDEVIATLRGWHAEDCGWLPNESGYSYPCNCGVPERMAAECAAKRAIIILAKKASELEKEYDDHEWQGTVESAEPLTGDAILYALAAVYADHPDYRQEWAPDAV